MKSRIAQVSSSENACRGPYRFHHLYFQLHLDPHHQIPQFVAIVSVQINAMRAVTIVTFLFFLQYLSREIQRKKNTFHIESHQVGCILVHQDSEQELSISRCCQRGDLQNRIGIHSPERILLRGRAALQRKSTHEHGGSPRTRYRARSDLQHLDCRLF